MASKGAVTVSQLTGLKGEGAHCCIVYFLRARKRVAIGKDFERTRAESSGGQMQDTWQAWYLLVSPIH